jgi:hypothetical protein
MFQTHFEYIPSLENIMPFRSKLVPMFRRKRAEVTDFSIWEVP